MTGADLILMRHGEPVRTGCFLGRLDLPSTPNGIADCVEAASGLDFERLISSPLQRSAAAAAEIARLRNVCTTFDERWQELDFGEWDGKSAAEISEAEPAALGLFWQDPDSNPPPGGENWTQIKQRVSGAVVEILSTGNASATLVVTHAGAMRAAVAVLCGFGFDQVMRLEIAYAARLRLRLFMDELGAPSASIQALEPGR